MHSQQYTKTQRTQWLLFHKQCEDSENAAVKCSYVFAEMRKNIKYILLSFTIFNDIKV